MLCSETRDFHLKAESSTEFDRWCETRTGSRLSLSPAQRRVVCRASSVFCRLVCVVYVGVMHRDGAR